MMPAVNLSAIIMISDFKNRILISISHSRDYAVASAIVEGLILKVIQKDFGHLLIIAGSPSMIARRGSPKFFGRDAFRALGLVTCSGPARFKFNLAEKEDLQCRDDQAPGSK